MRVVIADDNLLVRRGIAGLLEDAGVEVAAQASTGDEMLDLVDAHEPDVAIVDIRMPPTHSDEGLRAAYEIRRRHPAMGIVIVSEHVEVGVATRALAESPERLGYLLKQRVTDIADFVGTLRRVAAGGSALDPQVVSGLLGDGGVEVAAEASTGDELLELVDAHVPDVAIVDIRMPPTHTDEGLRAAQEIREKHPGVGVLVLSQYVEPAYAMELLAESAEGVGYLLKDRVADVNEFADAVRRVGDGGSALDPTIVSQLVGRRRGDDPIDQLTPREREVLGLMAEGRSNQGIADRLVVTERAVEKHVTSIFGKLRLPADAEDHRRVLAVLAYLRS